MRPLLPAPLQTVAGGVAHPHQGRGISGAILRGILRTPTGVGGFHTQPALNDAVNTRQTRGQALACTVTHQNPPTLVGVRGNANGNVSISQPVYTEIPPHQSRGISCACKRAHDSLSQEYKRMQTRLAHCLLPVIALRVVTRHVAVMEFA